MRFDYRLAHVCRAIKRQPGFVDVPYSQIRKVVRETNIGHHKRYWLQNGRQGSRVWYASCQIRRFASQLPFKCVFCGRNENPIEWNYDNFVLGFQDENTYICAQCHKTKLRGVMVELYALKNISSQLRKE